MYSRSIALTKYAHLLPSAVFSLERGLYSTRIAQSSCFERAPWASFT